DGTMYIVDMYHGIIQEGKWTPVGSYLRAKIEQYQLDKVIGLGRIWRLTHKDMERDKTKPRMYEESSAELVKHLEHPNGWWRDMAQQILVQRKDKTVTDALVQIVKSSNKLESKFNALWTLEGIGTLDSNLVKSVMADSNPRMRKMALWLSESLFKAGVKSFEKNYLQMMNDSDIEVKMRALMTGRLLKIPGTPEKAKEILKADTSIAGLKIVTRQIIDPPVVNAFFGRSNPNFNDEQKALVEKGSKIFAGLCSSCHGELGSGTPAAGGKLVAPSFINSARIQSHPDYIVKSLLHGIMGPIQKEMYTGIMMAPMKKEKDEWIAAVASFIRSNFENESSTISPADVARIRKESARQTRMYSFDSLWHSIPKVLSPDPSWKITASHTGEIRKGSTASPRGAFNFEGWTSGTSQAEGMWYMIEFPRVIDNLTEIHFRSQPINRGFRGNGPPPLHTSPSEYIVEVSLDGNVWTKVIDKGMGAGASTAIRFNPVKSKFVRISLTKTEPIVHGERRGKPFDYEVTWTMREMKVFGI
ncbi:MAG: c-type cytochrome, partial [Saprospiraceae bacterium]|nr:c-type cytochrome [Saprospiraceae bacterium]